MLLLCSVLWGRCVWLEQRGTVCADHTALERKGGLWSFLMSYHFYRFGNVHPPLRHWTDGAAKPFALFEIPHLSAPTTMHRPPTPLQKKDNAGRPGARKGEEGGGPTRYLISVSNTEATGSRPNWNEMTCPMWVEFHKQKLSNLAAPNHWGSFGTELHRNNNKTAIILN